MTSSTDIEWTSTVLDRIEVATADRPWVHRLSSVWSSNPFVQQIVAVGNKVTTQKLLDGAIAAGKTAVSSSNKSLALTRTSLIWQLAGLYHLTHFSPRLLEEAQKRFALAERRNLAQWAAQKAHEERGHDQLALLDIQSLGYSAGAVVKALVPSTAAALVDYFTQTVQSPDPIGCVGYSYTMERLAMNVGEKYIRKVEALLPSDIQATRCLRVHSGVGSDVEHVEETVEMVAGLLPQERAAVAIACYETAMLYFKSPKEVYMSEEELENVLEPLKSDTHPRG